MCPLQLRFHEPSLPGKPRVNSSKKHQQSARKSFKKRAILDVPSIGKEKGDVACGCPKRLISQGITMDNEFHGVGRAVVAMHVPPCFFFLHPQG